MTGKVFSRVTNGGCRGFVNSLLTSISCYSTRGSTLIGAEVVESGCQIHFSVRYDSI